MKKDGIYRFSLQFGANTEEQIRAGKLLEWLENKKSQIIVAALNEYMLAYPELENRDCKLEIKSSFAYNQEDIKRIIEDVIQSKFDNIQAPNNMEYDAGTMQENIAGDISQMLDNIDLFKYKGGFMKWIWSLLHYYQIYNSTTTLSTTLVS